MPINLNLELWVLLIPLEYGQKQSLRGGLNLDHLLKNLIINSISGRLGVARVPVNQAPGGSSRRVTMSLRPA